ncbi:hypothetical protein [Rhizobium leguminosarum]|uniref:hypothetical protein n=1 Tax=Rhizobium TaxID=379 RepID=UPI00103028FB|nr:hypothetical protein [Rhizobium leguminosarum]MBY5320970.1 hypothetical protein [Rhizobium leguminosarum]MBY5380852.1 hypothetical protein [Rhizobium leguminosarum]MCA2432157.1 hypothetical protein [Rhizobium leguminosarum]NEH72424.1 hypothetical protein [Rhizobium leguminosarum]NKL22950.1 hypothetical protein [Rhizobium leguminosarum bv. viciae]
MSGTPADPKDRARKSKIIAFLRKIATLSPTADDLIAQARQARSSSAEEGIDSADNQAYGLARPHKGPFDNATAFSASSYDHDLPTRQQLEAAQRSHSDAVKQQEANRQTGKFRRRARRTKLKSP